MSITDTSITPSEALPILTRNQMEANLDYMVEPGQSAGHRLNYVSYLINHIYRWNSQNGGNPNTWDVEKDQEFVEEAVFTIGYATLLALKDFASSCGLSYDFSAFAQILPDADADQDRSSSLPQAEQSPLLPAPGLANTALPKKEPAPAERDEAHSTKSPSSPTTQPTPATEPAATKKVRPLTPAQALEIARTNAGVKDHRGKITRGGGTVTGNYRAIEVIKLLHRSGGLTLDQLRFFMDFIDPKSVSARHEVQTTTKLLRSPEILFVEAIPHLGWRKSPIQTLMLTQAGEAFYSTLADEDIRESRKQSISGKGNLGHRYGIYQTLASIAGQLAATNKILPRPTTDVQIPHLRDDVAPRQPQLRLEWRGDVTLAYQTISNSKSSSSLVLRPDAIGSIQLDGQLATYKSDLMKLSALPVVESYEVPAIRQPDQTTTSMY
jgi:hypothetical protein